VECYGGCVVYDGGGVHVEATTGPTDQGWDGIGGTFDVDMWPRLRLEGRTSYGPSAIVTAGKRLRISRVNVLTGGQSSDGERGVCVPVDAAGVHETTAGEVTQSFDSGANASAAVRRVLCSTMRDTGW